MRIEIGYDIAFEAPAAVPMLLMLKVHPSREGDLEASDAAIFDPPIPSRSFIDRFGNRGTRLVAPAGRLRVSNRVAIRDAGQEDILVPAAAQILVDELPADTLEFLFGSRYCDTDHLSDIAWSTFAGVCPGWPRVQAICDYVHDRLTFSYSDACSTRTAREAHDGRRGVCRDFAHLAISFCRCMNIPARYCTGYLGDIGVPPDPAPMDFSAWFEAYLDGAWHTFDARHNIPRIGRIVIARGRDAADVAISTSFGPTRLVGFSVISREIPPGREPAALANSIVPELETVAHVATYGGPERETRLRPHVWP
ncbi:MAG TPA: transglutaminase family protein [Stellaceae bacterium]|nr:transglutaminase family protein [Stellaceae bacterium]